MYVSLSLYIYIYIYMVWLVVFCSSMVNLCTKMTQAESSFQGVEFPGPSGISRKVWVKQSYTQTEETYMSALEEKRGQTCIYIYIYIYIVYIIYIIMLCYIIGVRRARARMARVWVNGQRGASKCLFSPKWGWIWPLTRLTNCIKMNMANILTFIVLLQKPRLSWPHLEAGEVRGGLGGAAGGRGERAPTRQRRARSILYIYIYIYT